MHLAGESDLESFGTIPTLAPIHFEINPKLKANEATNPTSVLNLTSYILDAHEISVLEKGLNFIPKPNNINNEDVNEALQEFKRRVKLVSFF